MILLVARTREEVIAMQVVTYRRCPVLAKYTPGISEVWLWIGRNESREDAERDLARIIAADKKRKRDDYKIVDVDEEYMRFALEVV